MVKSLSITALSLNLLNIRTLIKNTSAIEICTIYLILVFVCSEIPSLFSRPRKSILTDVVRDVNAPSALGNAAEIRPIRNTIPATGPRYTEWQLSGKYHRLSSLLLPCSEHKSARSAPRKRNNRFTNTSIPLNVNIFF